MSIYGAFTTLDKADGVQIDNLTSLFGAKTVEEGMDEMYNHGYSDGAVFSAESPDEVKRVADKLENILITGFVPAEDLIRS